MIAVRSARQQTAHLVGTSRLSQTSARVMDRSREGPWTWSLLDTLADLCESHRAMVCAA